MAKFIRDINGSYLNLDAVRTIEVRYNPDSADGDPEWQIWAWVSFNPEVFHVLGAYGSEQRAERRMNDMMGGLVYRLNDGERVL